MCGEVREGSHREWALQLGGVDIPSRRNYTSVYNILEFAKPQRPSVLGWGDGEAGDVAPLIE